MSPTLVPDGHEAITILREVAGERLVLRTRRASGDCTVLVLLTPVPIHFASTLQGVVLRGRGSIEGLQPEVSRTLEGFRVRARIGIEPGLARVVDAGVLEPGEDAEYSGPAPAPGYGFAWVATAWVEGETLERVWPALDREARHRTLKEVAERLARLHKYGVFYGDLKPANVIVHEDHVATLIDMETLREVPGLDAPVRSLEYTPGYAAPEQVAMYEAYLSSDVWSFGALAASQWLGVPPDEAVRVVTQRADGGDAAWPEPWSDVLRACLRPVPASRPQATAVVAALDGARVALDGFMDAPAPPSRGGASPPTDPEASDETTRVNDPVPVALRMGKPSMGADTIPQPDPGSASEAPLTSNRIISITPRLLEAAGFRSEPALPHGMGGAPPEGPAQSAEAAPQPRSSPRMGGWRALRLLLTLCGLVVGAAVAQHAFGTYVEVRRSQARERADGQALEALHALERHKTEPELNGQEEIERILDVARGAVALADTPHALGTEALALVWSQRWHYSQARWDPEVWALADETTRRALVTPPSAEALLARGMALSASCRLGPVDEPVHARRCGPARRRLGQALQALPQIGEGAWLTVEARWAAEIVESTLAIRAFRSGDPIQAQRHAEAALGHCEAAWPILDAAPVNGDELAEDCIGAAGWAQDYEAFLRWSDRLLTRRGITSSEGARPELARIFRGGAFQCVGRDVGADGVPRQATRPGGWENLCDFVALQALGCPRMAREARHCEEDLVLFCGRYSKDADVAWDVAVADTRSPYRSSCLLSP